MKKFKVIEKSRFLDKGMMGKMQGGYFSKVCTDGNTYNNCPNLIMSYGLCEPISVSGFSSGTCPNGALSYSICGGTNYKYSYCLEVPGGGYGTPCAGDKIYCF